MLNVERLATRATDKAGVPTRKGTVVGREIRGGPSVIWDEKCDSSQVCPFPPARKRDSCDLPRFGLCSSVALNKYEMKREQL